MKARGAELYRQLHVPDFCREALRGMASREMDGASQGTAEVKSRLAQSYIPSTPQLINTVPVDLRIWHYLK